MYPTTNPWVRAGSWDDDDVAKKKPFVSPTSKTCDDEAARIASGMTTRRTANASSTHDGHEIKRDGHERQDGKPRGDAKAVEVGQLGARVERGDLFPSEGRVGAGAVWNGL